MMRGLWNLTWLEIKIFAREPLGAIGTVVFPVVAFLVLQRMAPRGLSAPTASMTGMFSEGGVAVFVSVLIAISAVQSLVTIVSIYRESGILKRLRATPLRPATILSAHVLAKLIVTTLTMVTMILAGRRYITLGAHVPVVSFVVALLTSVVSILSIGFVIASIVPTARFAQPIGALVWYPMIALSGLFTPVASLPPALRTIARLLPLTYVTSLLQGIWRGEGWMAHLTDLGALAAVFVVCIGVSSRVFRWE
ncbi:MAG: ABC transporter permease [Gemmatimonadota bacterium]|nr:ABC transporter permease [Gemmatimonadota bacterium]